MNGLSCEEMKDVILNAKANVQRFYGPCEIAESIAAMQARIERVATLCPALTPVYELALYIYQDAAKQCEPEEAVGSDADGYAPRSCSYHTASGAWRTVYG